MRFRLRRLGLCLPFAAALWAAPPLAAQLQDGNLHGTVVDPSGAPLAGAVATLSGGGGAETRGTDAEGRFRFLGLAPGAYRLEVTHPGRSPFSVPDLQIRVGRTVNLSVTLSPVEQETLTVTAEAPALDERRFSSGTSVPRAELDAVPTSRDPWAILRTTPGVLTDRINVGGTETGLQSRLVGPGSPGEQTVWSLDGMVITDMAALGSSPGQFDFDAFEEIQVTTGGNDAEIASGGVVVNLVTRRGTDVWRGSGRAYYSGATLRSGLDFDDEDLGQAGPWNRNHAQAPFRAGNRVERLTDLGLELGGPLVRDRLWVWGSYGDPKVERRTIADFSESTELPAGNLKLDAKLADGNSATLFFWHDDKSRHGFGASPQRPPETDWNQSRFGPVPTAWKVEDGQQIGSRLHLSVLASRVNGGFQLLPAVGDKVPFLDDDQVWHNSFFLTRAERAQRQVRGAASAYLDTRDVSHELRFGVGYRTALESSLSRTPGGGWECCGGIAAISRDAQVRYRGRYVDAFASDTATFGRFTVNAGLRYDRQGGRNLPIEVRANPAFPELLPAISVPGGDGGFEWSNVVPRLGATWALGRERTTLVRASYSRYADQLGTDTAAFVSPAANPQYLYFYTTNGGGETFEPDELLDSAGPPTGGINPLNFGPLVSNQIDPELEAPITDEVLLGVERALRPDLVIGLRVTWRRLSKLLERELLVFDDPDPRSPENLNRRGRPHRRDDYVLQGVVSGMLPNGQSFTTPYWTLRDGVSTRGGARLENGDREQEFRGAFLTFDKRLGHRWMLRGNLGVQDWRWRIPEAENEDPTDAITGGVVDGSQVLSGSNFPGGAKGNVFLNSRWSYALTGLVQIAPGRLWGFDLAASATGHQGYPLRYAVQQSRAELDESRLTYLPASSRLTRYPDVHVLDLRIQKEIRRGDFSATWSLDCFNALNRATVLQRQALLGRNTSDHVLEVLGARILRLGVRFSFK